jgi:hypothetical protein
MYYHFSIILIFYPLINLRFLSSNISALGVCTDAADAVVILARSYDTLHGLRRTPCFVPYMIFAAGIAHLGDTTGRSLVDALTHTAQEVDILQLTSPYHGSSKHACRVLLSRGLHSSSLGQAFDKSATEGVYSPWEPFMATMTWPRGDTRKYSSFLKGITRTGVSVREPTYEEQLRGNGFERIM